LFCPEKASQYLIYGSISKDYLPGSMFHYLRVMSGKDKGGLKVNRAMTSKALSKDAS
jgi:hypothetical protein